MNLVDFSLIMTGETICALIHSSFTLSVHYYFFLSLSHIGIDGKPLFKRLFPAVYNAFRSFFGNRQVCSQSIFMFLSKLFHLRIRRNNDEIIKILNSVTISKICLLKKYKRRRRLRASHDIFRRMLSVSSSGMFLIHC